MLAVDVGAKDSPLHALSRLVRDCEPSKAADVLARYMSWRWPVVTYDPEAPLIVRNMADQTSWQRFSASDPITQKEVAAHCLFRAASYQTGATRAKLAELAQSLVREVVDAWLIDRPNL